MRQYLHTVRSEGSAGCRWIGQGGFLFTTSTNRVILIDPYLSNSVSLVRLVPIPLRPEEVEAHLVLCTHADTDHADPETIPKMVKVRLFAGPSSVVEKLHEWKVEKHQIATINRGEETTLAGIHVRAVYAKHTPDSVGYVMEIGGIRFYITGDTEYDDQLRQVWQFEPDVMCICINGRWGNMGIGDAVRVAEQVRPKVVIPMHYGMFAENTADPEEFVREIEQSRIPVKPVVLEFNRAYLFSKQEDEVVFQAI